MKRQGEMVLKCIRRGSIWILGKKISIERVVKHWDRLPMELMESLSLEMFKKKGADVAL